MKVVLPHVVAGFVFLIELPPIFDDFIISQLLLLFPSGDELLFCWDEREKIQQKECFLSLFVV